MKTNATLTGPNGKVKLVFGIYGLKSFCKRLGCEPAIFSILSAFQGGTKLEAISEIVRSGMEQASVDANGNVELITEYEACEVLEAATEKEAESAMKAFFSSIVGDDYDTWFAKLEADTNTALAKAEESTEKKSVSTGTTSNPKPTES